MIERAAATGSRAPAQTGLGRRRNPQPGERVQSFRQARAARRAETAEDYVELIAELIAAQGEARTVDIAARLGIAPATVAKTVARLARDNFVVHQPYRSIFLTEEGRSLAETARHRHRLVVAFLLTLGVSEEIAERDAEGIEHHVSEETLTAFAQFVSNR